MKQITLMEKYPIYTLEIDWGETEYKNINEVCSYFVDKIEKHPKAAFIALFDHYTHTKNMSDGEIAANIKDAKNVVFCFGPKIPNPQILAIRPRSIGVCDMGKSFVVSFLEAPMESINKTMEEWALGIKK